MNSTYILFVELFVMFCVAGVGFYCGRMYELKIRFRMDMLEIQMALKEIYQRRERRDANSKA